MKQCLLILATVGVVWSGPQGEGETYLPPQHIRRSSGHEKSQRLEDFDIEDNPPALYGTPSYTPVPRYNELPANDFRKEPLSVQNRTMDDVRRLNNPPSDVEVFDRISVSHYKVDANLPEKYRSSPLIAPAASSDQSDQGMEGERNRVSYLGTSASDRQTELLDDDIHQSNVTSLEDTSTSTSHGQGRNPLHGPPVNRNSFARNVYDRSPYQVASRTTSDEARSEYPESSIQINRYDYHSQDISQNKRYNQNAISKFNPRKYIQSQKFRQDISYPSSRNPNDRKSSAGTLESSASYSYPSLDRRLSNSDYLSYNRRYDGKEQFPNAKDLPTEINDLLTIRDESVLFQSEENGKSELRRPNNLQRTPGRGRDNEIETLSQIRYNGRQMIDNEGISISDIGVGTLVSRPNKSSSYPKFRDFDDEQQLRQLTSSNKYPENNYFGHSRPPSLTNNGIQNSRLIQDSSSSRRKDNQYRGSIIDALLERPREREPLDEDRSLDTDADIDELTARGYPYSSNPDVPFPDQNNGAVEANMNSAGPQEGDPLSALDRNSNEAEHHFQTPSDYDFSYHVRHPQHRVDFGHREHRVDEQAQGEYFVLLPDGRTQVVEYKANEEGYKPNIRYEKANSTFLQRLQYDEAYQ